MAAINRFGMNSKSTPLFFRVATGVFIPLFTITIIITTPLGDGAVALTRLDFTRKKSKIERFLFFEKRSRMAWPLL